MSTAPASSPHLEAVSQLPPDLQSEAPAARATVSAGPPVYRLTYVGHLRAPDGVWVYGRAEGGQFYRARLSRWMSWPA